MIESVAPLAQYLDKGTAAVLLLGFIWAMKFYQKKHEDLCEKHKEDIREHTKSYKTWADRCIDVFERNIETNTRLTESIKHLETKL